MEEIMRLLKCCVSAVVAFGFLATSLMADLPDIDDSQTGKDFFQLAKQSLDNALKEAKPKLAEFHDDIKPHESKDKRLRKAVLKIRDMLDIFPYAYSSNPAEDDFFKVFRDDLDEGYEHLGLFKDLWDMQFIDDIDDADELADYKQFGNKLGKRHSKAQEWIKAFLKRKKQSKYGRFALNPTKEMYYRPKDTMSRFYWRIVNGEPSAEKTGLANVADLARQLSEIARDEYEEAKGITDVLDHVRAEAFHDFRKRVRTVIKIIKYFPGVVVTTDANREVITAAYDELSDAVSQIGGVNDHVTARRFWAGIEEDEDVTDEVLAELDDNEKEKVRHHEEEAEKGYEGVLTMYEEKDLPGLLTALIQGFPEDRSVTNAAADNTDSATDNADSAADSAADSTVDTDNASAATVTN